MGKFLCRGWLRSLTCALVCGCVGFCYAVSTSANGKTGQTSSRAIGTDCTRAETTFFTASDLGVVVIGSLFSRQILVQFGFKPHTFSISDANPSTSGFSISSGGTLTGIKEAAGIETFTVQVVDGIDVEVPPRHTRTFSILGVDPQENPALALTLVNSNPVLAVTPLPDALANEPYTFSLHANGGTAPYRFKLNSSADFAALPSGLALDSNGFIFGKPATPTLTGQPAVFTVLVRDNDGNSITRTFSLNVRSGTISSGFVAITSKFSLNFGREGDKDSFQISMVLNKAELAAAGIRDVADLEGVAFLMQLGGVLLPNQAIEVDGTTGQPTGNTFPTVFDKNGTIRFPNLIGGASPERGEDTRYEINFNPKTGLLRGTFHNFDLIEGLGANFASFNNPIIPLNVKIGAAAQEIIDAILKPETDTTTGTTTTEPVINYQITDSIQFTYRRSGSKGSGQSKRNQKDAPGGLFLITKAIGKERVSRVAGNPPVERDRLSVDLSGFLRLPGGVPLIPKATDMVSVLLGTKCLGEFSATSLATKGSVISFFNDDTNAKLKSLVIDNKKGTFSVTTFPMDPFELFGQDILEAGKPFTIPLTLQIKPQNSTELSFDGQAPVTLFRRGNVIRNK
jgi:hypothetical protein